MTEETKRIHCGKNSRWPKTLADLYASVNAAMKRSGYGEEESHSLSVIAIKAVSDVAGGRQFYMPVGMALERAARNIKIFNEFDGRNVLELSEKYKITQTQIYAIIKSERAGAKQGRQDNSQN